MQLQTKVGSNKKIALLYHPKLRGMWPPEPGGAFTAGSASPIGGADVLESVFYYAPVGHAKANVSLKTIYQGQYHTRDLLIDDSDFAERLASFLRDKAGQTVADLGNLEIDF